MTESDIITSLISLIAVAIALATLQQNRNIIKESNRAYIVLFIDRGRSDKYKSIVLKNFGKSSGTLLSVSIDPPLLAEKSKFNKKHPVITDHKNIFFAPGQTYKTHFDFDNYDKKNFNVSISYITLGKTINENYQVDLSFRESLLYVRNEEDTELEALKSINQSILEISDKFH